MTLLDELCVSLGAMSEDERNAQVAAALKATEGLRFVPNPGPQTEAYFSPADLLLYGGEGGGGKSALGVGVGMTAHRRSLVIRKRFADLEALTDIAVHLHGSRKGFSGGGRPKLETADGRLLVFGANQHDGDEQAWQGHPFDFKYFDEGAQLREKQVRFHLGWLRIGPGIDPNQRRRAIIGTNPPIDADGDWIVGMFRPWLDLTHPKPARDGELRWYITDEDGKDFEVDGPRPIERSGHVYVPKSRSFIRARLSDNPYLINTGYQAELDALPEPLRSAIRDGNFMAARPDAPTQVIPMAWIIAAQNRWQPDGWKAFAMTAMAIDPAGGGADACEICCRHGGWYGPIATFQGPETADGNAMAAQVVRYRRDACPVVVDVGGGYGGAVMLRLKDNGIDCARFDGGSTQALGTTNDGSNLKFKNRRAQAWWRMREALDPEQQGGSVIALPPDPELRADLAAPTWELKPDGILVEGKDKLRDRLGRSPGKGDTVVMCLSEGNAAVRRSLRGSKPRPDVQIGYAHLKPHLKRRQ